MVPGRVVYVGIRPNRYSRHGVSLHHHTARYATLTVRPRSVAGHQKDIEPDLRGKFPADLAQEHRPATLSPSSNSSVACWARRAAYQRPPQWGTSQSPGGTVGSRGGFWRSGRTHMSTSVVSRKNGPRWSGGEAGGITKRSRESRSFSLGCSGIHPSIVRHLTDRQRHTGNATSDTGPAESEASNQARHWA